MAEIVAGFLLPHDPLIAAVPQAPPEAQRKICMDAYAAIAERIRELEVDTVIVIGDDHYTIHSPVCIPSCLIAIGDVEGPWEDWLNIERCSIPNNEALATHIMRHGLDNGIDWAVAKTICLDHSTVIPIHYAVRPAGEVRSIPVYLNSGLEPLVSSRRAYQIGKAIGDAVAAWPGNERVAIYGTGGLGHWPGMAEMGKVVPEWDHRIMHMVEQGDIASLMAFSDEEILREGGNGGLEIKNWLCAMGALPGCRGRLIAYEAVQEWVCGCAYMALESH